MDAMKRLPSHTKAVRAPETCFEATYIMSETACLLHRHTCRQWGCCNVLCGMSWYCGHGPDANHPSNTMALEGKDALAGLAPESLMQMKALLLTARKYMILNQGWKFRSLDKQLRHWGQIGMVNADIAVHSGTSHVLKNAYVVFRDRQLQRITLCIRGSSSVKDFCTSFTAVPMEFSARDATGVHVNGYAHLGAALASRWLYEQLRPVLETELAASPGWKLQLTGHSIGGACASLVAMQIRDDYANPAEVAASRGISEAVAKEMAAVQCLTIACPPCMSENLAHACSSYVLAVMNNGDVVPLLSLSNGHRLLSEVDRAPWCIGRLAGLLRCVLPKTGAHSSGGAAAMTATSSSGNRPDVPYVPELYPAGRIVHMVPCNTWCAVRPESASPCHHGSAAKAEPSTATGATAASVSTASSDEIAPDESGRSSKPSESVALDTPTTPDRGPHCFNNQIRPAPLPPLLGAPSMSGGSSITVPGRLLPPLQAPPNAIGVAAHGTGGSGSTVAATSPPQDSVSTPTARMGSSESSGPSASCTSPALAKAKAPPAQLCALPGGFMLLEVPPTSYTRIAPGSGWGQHWIPPYLASLDRVLEAIDDRLGVGACP